MSKSTERRHDLNLKRWLLVALAGIAALTALATGCNTKGGVPSGALPAGKVAADGISYYGQDVKIYGYVSAPVVGGAFQISDAVSGTVSLPVIVKEMNVSVALGEKVLVEGIPTAFDAGRIKQNYAIEVPGETTRGWENRPVVIADRVSKLE